MTPENPHRASDVAQAVNEGEPVNPTSARAGRPNPRILVILVVSTIAAALLLLGLWALTNNAFVANSDESGAPQEVSAFQGDAQTRRKPTPRPTPQETLNRFPLARPRTSTPRPCRRTRSNNRTDGRKAAARSRALTRASARSAREWSGARP
jgi:hypothetical protein